MDTMTKKQEVSEAMEALKELVKPGDTVYTVLRSVSKSGMFRRIDLYVIKDNQPLFLTGRVATVLGLRYSMDDWRKSAGLGVSGCGMDMGFHVVYELSAAMFRTADDKYSHDGAYSLKQRWL